MTTEKNVNEKHDIADPEVREDWASSTDRELWSWLGEAMSPSSEVSSDFRDRALARFDREVGRRRGGGFGRLRRAVAAAAVIGLAVTVFLMTRDSESATRVTPIDPTEGFTDVDLLAWEIDDIDGLQTEWFGR